MASPQAASLERSAAPFAGREPETCSASDVARRAQRRHALAILVLPPLGTALALWLARDGLAARDLALALLFLVAAMLGVSVGFHRHLAHGAFQARPWVRAVLVVCGSMAAQGPPLYWVANHRRHHQHSDEPGDPHSPHFDGQRPLSGWSGFLHAHVGWTFGHELTNPLFYCRDLLRDPLLARLNRLYLVWVALGLLLPAALGALAGGVRGAWGGLLWGGLVRGLLSYHLTASINSVTHLVGRRDFPTTDRSRNTLWLVLPTVGEGWHNNHHAFPGSAYFGLGWKQLDPGAWLVAGLQALGLAWQVHRPSPAQIEARRAGGAA